MRVINQTWEMRNLGLNAVELRFENSDSATSVDNGLSQIQDDVDYIQATIPSNKMDIVYKLQKYGFVFSESQIILTADLSTLSLPQSLKKRYSKVRYHIANDEELLEIYDRLKNGLFDSDRFTNNPDIGKIKSGNRYYEWCKSEAESGNSDVYMVHYNDRPIGFFVLKIQENGDTDGIMGGLFNKEQDVGKGFAVLYPPMEIAQNRHSQYIITSVSSNNLSSLRMHLSLGYEIQDLVYIFTRMQSTL